MTEEPMARAMGAAGSGAAGAGGSVRKGLIIVAVALPVVVAAGCGGWWLNDVAKRGDRAAEAAALYDAEALKHVDPALLKWREVGRVETGLKSVKGFALLGDGRLAVAGERKVRILEANGQKVLDIPLEGVPQTVAADGDRLYVALKDHVEVFTTGGQRVAEWSPLEAGAFLTCISVHGKDVYLADAGRRVVVHCDATGRVLGELARADEAKDARGLVVPSAHLDVAVAGDGKVWISNPGRHALEGYGSDGRMVETWGTVGTTIDKFTGCCNPTDFTFLPDGRFVTTEKGVARVKVYSARGELESVVAGPEAFAEDAAGLDVAADGQGRIFVLDTSGMAVRVYGAIQ